MVDTLSSPCKEDTRFDLDTSRKQKEDENSDNTQIDTMQKYEQRNMQIYIYFMVSSMILNAVN